MRLLSLFEEEDEIAIKDPKAQQAIKLARATYGWAGNDLEAFVAMIQDQQYEQDKDIEAEYRVNTDQEKGISTNDHDINSLEQRISNLEQDRVKEGINEDNIDWEPQPEFRNRGGVSTSFGDAATRQRNMKGMPTSNRRYKRQPTNQEDTRIQEMWTKLKKAINQNPANKTKYMQVAKKLRVMAKQQGIILH